MNTFRKILTKAVGVPESATDDQIALALTEMLRPGAQPTATLPPVGNDDPQADFDKLAKLFAKTHSVSLGEAYSRVSQECPILYERATAKARLN